MDSYLRQLIRQAQQDPESAADRLTEAYTQIKSILADKKPNEALSIGFDLFVLLAEEAVKNGLDEISKESLRIYLALDSPSNQFRARALLAQAKLLRPSGSQHPESLEKPIAYILKTIELCRKNPQYHFLVFNASVIYCELVRPFLKPLFRRYLCSSLAQIVKALEQIDDKDFEWRAELLKTLLECHLDAGQRKEALLLAEQAANFVTKNAPHCFKDLLEVISMNSLGEHGKLQWWIRGSAELAIYYRLCKLKLAIREHDAEVQPQQEMMKIFRQLLAEDDVTVQAPKGKKDSKKGQATSKADAQAISTKRLSQHSAEKPKLLLELGRLSLDQNNLDMTRLCLSAIRSCPPLPEQNFYTEVEFLNCSLIVRKLGANEESLAKPIVELRLQAIERCHEALCNAVRQNNADTIQAGCATQFNLALPLLQPNLRHLLRRQLTLVAECLENIGSLQCKLRCQLHMELALIEADLEQIKPALTHLSKAASLDDFSEYKEAIANLQKRLTLRAELYTEPDTAEDTAGQILEQAQAAGRAASVRMKRALLLKVGHALAPDAFLQAMEAEAKQLRPSGDPLQLQLYRSKVQQYTACVDKIAGHLKRLGSTNDRLRARLWADLARTARKQEVWDVCRIASRFCLLYDDSRWKNPLPAAKPEMDAKKKKQQKPQQSSPDLGATGSVSDDHDSDAEKSKRGSVDSRGSDAFLESYRSGPPARPNLYELELVRTLAEVRFICAESHIHLLRSEGVELLDRPLPPRDTRKLPKGYARKNPDQDPDWLLYCDWLTELSQFCLNNFIRAAQIGVELNESWLVSSAGAYVWNYTQHLLQLGQQHQLSQWLVQLVDCLRKSGHENRSQLLLQLCSCASYGLIQRWLPALPPPLPAPDEAAAGAGAGSESKRKPGSGRAKPQAAASAQISAEAAPDCKRAVEIAAFALEVAAKPEEAVPLRLRYPLLQVWLQAKQMVNQPVGKGLGVEEGVESYDAQRAMTRACVAVEMLWLGRNGVMEFKEAPGVGEAANMVAECAWSDAAVLLQLWVKLAYIALEMTDHQLVSRSCEQALQLDSELNLGDKKGGKHKQSVSQELLSIASSLKGQSLLRVMQGKIAVRRQALAAFLQSCRYACSAGNYQLVSAAARHYWNAAVPLVAQPIERELLREPFLLILDALATTVDKKRIRKLFERADGEEEENRMDQAERKHEQRVQIVQQSPQQSVLGLFPPSVTVPPSAEQLQEELSLRAAMYGVLFQAYADKGDLDRGLKAMDDAIANMPRTKHRLLIFKHRILTRAKLGQSVAMDIQKFRSEPEDKQAELWRIVALSSKDATSQLDAYRNAIQCLTKPENDWIKIDLLTEFSQWLYTNNFPIEICTAQLDWAIDILLSMSFEQPLTEEPDKKSKGRHQQQQQHRQKQPSSQASKRQQQPQQQQQQQQQQPSGKAAAADEEDQQQQFVPVEKKIIIGVDSNKSPATSINNLSNARQLDCLLRTFTLLSQLLSPASAQHRHTVQSACACVLRLLQLSIPAALPVVKEMAKMKAEEKGGGGGKAGGKANAGKGKEPPKEKPKRKGGLDFVPQTVEDWASYDIPDEVLEAFKRQELMPNTGLGKHNVVKPTLTLHYCRLLVEKLRSSGLSHWSLPVLVLQDLITRDLCKCRPAYALVHLVAQSICQECHLTKGADFHELCAGDLWLSSEEQTQNRQLVVQWKEKRAQVKREEAKAQDTLRSLAEELGRDVAELQAAAGIGANDNDNSESAKETLAGGHLGEELDELRLYREWLLLGRQLLQQGQYQPARLLFREAHITACELQDTVWQAKSLAELGRLALLERQFGQAAASLHKAQALMQSDGDEQFWFDTSRLLVEAIADDYTKKDALRLAKAEALKAISTFECLARRRQNKKEIILQFVGCFEWSFGNLQLRDVQHRLDSRLCSSHHAQRSLEISSKFLQQSLNRLTASRSFNESIACFADLAECQLRMSELAGGDTDRRRQLLLDAIATQKAATRYAELFVADARNGGGVSELRSVNLPADRLAADAKLRLARLLLLLFEEECQDRRQRQQRRLELDETALAVEDFVQDEPLLQGWLAEWHSVAGRSLDTALAHLRDAHSLSQPIGCLRAASLQLIGRALRLQAACVDPDAEGLWLVGDAADAAAAAADAADAAAADVADAGNDEEASGESPREASPLSEKQLKVQQQLLQQRLQFSSSLRFLSQATEVLHQAASLAICSDSVDTASSSSLELLECMGQYDINSSWLMLSLHQSAEAAKKLRQLLQLALRDSALSETAALLNQLQNLESQALFANHFHSKVVALAKEALRNSSVAWKMCSLDVSHHDLSKSLPQFLNFVLLQHSPDRKFLYAAALDKSRNKAVKGQQAVNHSFIMRISTSSSSLNNLIDESRDLKSETGTLLLKHEYQRSQLAKQKRMLQAISAEPDVGDERFPLELEQEINEDLQKLQNWFDQIVSSVSNLLQPCLLQLQLMHRATTAATPSTSKREQHQQQQEQQQQQQQQQQVEDDFTVVLADSCLAETPLEAVGGFHFHGQTGISRDFSLQLFARRFHGVRLGDEGEAAQQEARPKGKEKGKVPSRIPGLRDASKKQSKIIPLIRPVPAGYHAVDTTHIRHVIDPKLECADTEQHRPIEEFKQMMDKQERIQQFTPRWLGVCGDDHAPSIGEYEVYLREASGFLFYGMERFLAQLPPHAAVGLGLSDCKLVALFDLAHTSASFLRQSKVDVVKRSEQLQMEKPVETAMLMTLAGVTSLCCQQFASDLSDNANRLEQFLAEILEGGKPVGEAVSQFYESKRRNVDSDTQATTAGSETAATKSESADGEGGSDTGASENGGAGAGPELAAARSCFNMVLYGLPNVIVTLIDK